MFPLEPDYRAQLAEFIAQVRYAADEYDRCGYPDDAECNLIRRLRALVGPWPHGAD